MATFAVIVLPALAVSFIETSGRPWLVLSTVLLAMLLSIAIATVGSALWIRRPNSRDLVFGDLMLWGWVRRVRAVRRLAEAQVLLDSQATGTDEQRLTRERRRKVLQRLAAMLEAKDPDTLGHSRRVMRLTERIAREMGLSRAEVAKVRIAASVHDVGKVHTPRELLTKPGRLTEAEFEVMKRHTLDGARMASELGDPEITAMVRHHHERLDGSGYPDGLRGTEIPLGARIISVADTFDAITSSRVYHGARNHQRGLDVVSRDSGSRLDPDAVAAFRRYYSGKRAIAWSAFGLTGPPRLASWVSGLPNGVSGLTTPVAQSLAGILAAALAGASLAGDRAAATVAGDPTPASATRPDASASRPRVSSETPKGSERVSREFAERRSALVRDRTGNGPRRENPGQGSTDEPAPPGDTVSPPPPAPPPVPNVDLPGGETPVIEVPEVRLPPVEVPLLQIPLPQIPLPQVLPQPREVQVQLPLSGVVGTTLGAE